MRVALLKPCCIGDVVFATALLAATKRAWPDAEIDWLVSDWAAEALTDHPLLRRTVSLGPGATPARTLSGLARLVRLLRAERYDVLFVPDRSPKLSFAALLSGIPKRIGLDSAGRGFGYTHRAPLDPHAIRHEADIYLDLARVIGFPIDGCYANVTPSAAARAEMLVTLKSRLPEALARRWVIVHPGGGINPGMSLTSKRWPSNRIAALTKRVADLTNGLVMMVGGKTDQAIVQAINRVLPPNLPRVDLTGLPLPVLAALAAMPNVELVIGNDTGSVHLMAAAGARTLMIFGPSDPGRYGPFVPSERAAAVWRPVAVPERGVAAGGAAGFDWERDGVTVDEAWEQVQRLLQQTVN